MSAIFLPWFSAASRCIALCLVAAPGFLIGPVWADTMPASQADSSNWIRPAVEVPIVDSIRDSTAYVRQKALSLIGIPYRRGGTSPKNGFDCSGFVQYVMRAATGARIGRTAAIQATEGLPVEQGQLQAGDLVFFNTLGRKFSHVGLYLGNGEFVHSPAKGGRVRLESLYSPYWQRHYVVGERMKTFNQNALRSNGEFVDGENDVKDGVPPDAGSVRHRMEGQK
ncbi:C40 family peptidase [Burkholderia pyrrocinia]|uniref:C40 family peptidase n=1 Tax=Burkholderia pyrrocinia TaxID=60550 RepID=UPI0038B44F4B